MSSDTLVCGHDATEQHDYSGAVCGACYRSAEFLLPTIPASLDGLRTIVNRAGALKGTTYGERVQESREQRLPIDVAALDMLKRLELALAAAVEVSQAEARTVYYGDRGVGVLVDQVQRDLWLTAANPDAWHELHELTEAARDAHRATNPGHPGKSTKRAKCGLCLAQRVRIELRKIGEFHSVCGGCGNSKPIRVVDLAGVLDARDSDGSSETGGALPHDTMALSG